MASMRSSFRVFFLRALLVLALGGLSVGARADAPSDADLALGRKHFELGSEYYARGRFEAAAAEFTRAYELTRAPELLYNLYLCHRDAGSRERAADALERYLATSESVENRELLEERLRALRRDEPTAPEPSREPDARPPVEGPAFVGHETPRATEPELIRGQAWFDFRAFRGSSEDFLVRADARSRALLFGGTLEIRERFGIDVRWGLAWARTELTILNTVSERSSARAGNPFLGGYYTNRLGPIRWNLGAGLAFPVLRPVRTLDDHAQIAIAIATPGLYGAYDPYLWVADRLTPVARGAVEYAFEELLRLRLEQGFGVLVFTGDDRDYAEAQETEFLYQAALEAEYTPIREIGIGVRFQGVYLSLSDDEFQSSFEPYLVGRYGPAFARVGFLMNLDEPYGFSFEDDRVWAVSVRAGADF